MRRRGCRARRRHRSGPTGSAAPSERLLFTGDPLSGAETVEWVWRSRPSAEALDTRIETLVQRIAQMPPNQLQVMKLLVNHAMYARGLPATQVLRTVFDGIARHTRVGYEFQDLAAREGLRAAGRERDDPFGEHGGSAFKG